MKILKLILFLLVLGAGAYLLLWLFGVIASLFWYVFWIGLLLLGGTVGYKLFLSGNKASGELEEGRPTAINELEDIDRTLEEMKQKYLPEQK
ncbi:MAG: hypothetical protein R2684_06535 [Pyrinomonadaceae bacterium]